MTLVYLTVNREDCHNLTVDAELAKEQLKTLEQLESKLEKFADEIPCYGPHLAGAAQHLVLVATQIRYLP